MNAIPPSDAWIAGMEAIADEAAGAVELAIVMQDEFPSLMCAALAGSPSAEQLLRLTFKTLATMDEPGRKPLLCATCPAPVGNRFNFALAIPATGSSHSAVALAVCINCATDPAGVEAKALVGLRRLWPDLRPIRVHPESGRA